MIRNSRRVVVLAVAGAVAIAPVISGCGAGREPQSAAPSRLSEGVNVSLPTKKAEAAQINLRNMFLLGGQSGETLKAGASLPLYGVMINQVEGRQDRLVSVSSPVFGQARIEGGGITLPPAAADGTGSAVKLLGKAHPAPATTPSGEKKTKQPTGTPTQEPTGTGATPNTSGTPTSGNTTGPQESALPATPAGEQPLVVLTGLTRDLLAGTDVPVRMQFEHAGTVEFQAPVVPHQGDFLTYPLASPTGPASGGPTPSPSTSPSHSPSHNPSHSPSPGAAEPTTEPTQGA
ncbi:hypothetical protein [Actinomadura formosensis]|uniref:hypothetical protein n=1 Tax=Actinomadura formosensis TaxID=60706 RepID=UPI001040E7BD|nr:hypothetical protein [Actinomadura formosensis]